MIEPGSVIYNELSDAWWVAWGDEYGALWGVWLCFGRAVPPWLLPYLEAQRVD